MARLALALDGSALESDRRLSIDRRTLRRLAGALGDTVLLYRHVAGSFVIFLAMGKVAGIEIGSEEGRFFCRFVEVRAFSSPPVRSGYLTVPGAVRRLELTPEEFEALVTEGRGKLEAAGIAEEGVAEPSAPLAETAPVRVYRQVLQGWGYRCAITGQRFEAGSLPHRDLRLAWLRPRNQGGPLHVQNLMPMIASAEEAWTRGHLSATGDHRIVMAVRDVGLQLFDQIEAIGTLHLPQSEALQPDAKHLAYHFSQIFGR